MVRTTKSSVNSMQSAAPIVDMPEKIQVDTPVKEAPVKKERKPKAAKALVAEVAPQEIVPELAPVAEVAETEVVAATPEQSLGNKLSEFSLKLHSASAALSSLRAQFKVIERSFAKELKAAQKSSKKTKRAGNRQPSGFIRPTMISDELALFLGKPIGTEIARTEVSKEINKYIRENSLQDKENGRKIIPDAKLAALLRMTPTDVLTYFNLQRYMKGHFIKAEPVVAAVEAVAV